MSRKIAILGAGKIGESLIAGLVSSGWRRPDEIVATGRRDERLAELEERHGITTTRSNREAAADAAVVVIAVKPQDIEELLRELTGALEPAQTVVSIAAAIPTELIERHLGEIRVGSRARWRPTSSSRRCSGRRSSSATRECTLSSCARWSRPRVERRSPR